MTTRDIPSHDGTELAKNRRSTAPESENRYQRQKEKTAEKSYQFLQSDKDLNRLDRAALINALDAEHAYAALLNLNNLALEDREVLRAILIEDCNPQNAYLALRDIIDLTPDERKSLVARTDAQNAYDSLYNIETLTPDERAQLIDKLDAQNAYDALCDVENLTYDERQALKAVIIQRCNAEYAYIALCNIQGLTSDDRLVLIQKSIPEYTREVLNNVKDLTPWELEVLEAEINNP